MAKGRMAAQEKNEDVHSMESFTRRTHSRAHRLESHPARFVEGDNMQTGESAISTTIGIHTGDKQPFEALVMVSQELSDSTTAGSLPLGKSS